MRSLRAMVPWNHDMPGQLHVHSFSVTFHTHSHPLLALVHLCPFHFTYAFSQPSHPSLSYYLLSIPGLPCPAVLLPPVALSLFLPLKSHNCFKVQWLETVMWPTQHCCGLHLPLERWAQCSFAAPCGCCRTVVHIPSYLAKAVTVVSRATSLATTD